MILTDLNCVAAYIIQIFPMIHLLQSLLACESPRSLLPTVPSRHLCISATCKTIWLTTQKTGPSSSPTMQDIFSFGRVGSKYWLGILCLTCLVFRLGVTHLSLFFSPKHKHTSAGRKEGRALRLVRLPCNLMDLICAWLKGIRGAAAGRGLAFTAHTVCQHILVSLPFPWVGFSHSILWLVGLHLSIISEVK